MTFRGPVSLFFDRRHHAIIRRHGFYEAITSNQVAAGLNRRAFPDVAEPRKGMSTRELSHRCVFIAFGRTITTKALNR